MLTNEHAYSRTDSEELLCCQRLYPSSRSDTAQYVYFTHQGKKYRIIIPRKGDPLFASSVNAQHDSDNGQDA